MSASIWILATYDVVRLTYDVVSYIARATSKRILDVRHRTCDVIGLYCIVRQIRYRIWNIQFRVSILKHVAYDIVCPLLTYDIVGTGRTMSYAHVVYDVVCTIP